MDTSFLPRAGRGGLPLVRLVAPDGARADVYLHGAHVTAWTPAGEAESRLFLSDRAAFAEGKALRGGIPVVFPQFSDAGPFVRHGFARTRAWALDAAGLDDAGGAYARFSLADDAATHALWPHSFRLALTVRVAGPTLAVHLGVHNPGPGPFAFTAALHTYLAAEARAATVTGLRGTAYADTAAGGIVRTDGADAVTFDGGEVDRLYRAAPSMLRLDDGARALDLVSEGFEDAVVWNPGDAKGAALADLAPGDARRFVCVEAAQAARPVVLTPGAAWHGGQRLAAL